MSWKRRFLELACCETRWCSAGASAGRCRPALRLVVELPLAHRGKRVGKVLDFGVAAVAGPDDLDHVEAAGMVEQVVRPTGLLDPEIEVRPVATQVDDVLSEINARVGHGETDNFFARYAGLIVSNQPCLNSN